MNIKNFIRNFGGKKAGIVAGLILLIFLLGYLYMVGLLPLYLAVFWGVGCIVIIGLNLYDRKKEMKKMGETLIANARELHKRGEVKGAIRDYTRSLELRGPSLEAYLGLGNCYRGLNDYKKALEYARKAQEYKDDSAAALYLMGLCLFRQDFHDSALKHLEKALRISPEFIDCYLIMGEIYVSLGRKEEAVKNYSKYIEGCGDDNLITMIREKIEKLSG